VPTLLHVGVEWTTALRHDPVNVLCGILDIAGLAVHAVLKVDHQLFVNVLVHASRTVSTLRRSVD